MEERACFQPCEDRLRVLFPVFHYAVEVCLQRTVAARKYPRPKRLLREVTGAFASPALANILQLLPPNQRSLIIA